MEFSRQEYWSGFFFLLWVIFLTLGLNPSLLHLLHYFPIEWPWYPCQKSADHRCVGLFLDSNSIPLVYVSILMPPVLIFVALL